MLGSYQALKFSRRDLASIGTQLLLLFLVRPHFLNAIISSGVCDAFVSQFSPNVHYDVSNSWISLSRRLHQRGRDLVPFSSRVVPDLPAASRSIDVPDLPGLVTTEWLADHVDDEDLAILDIRGEVSKAPVTNGTQETEYIALKGDYVDAHIPNAAFVDWIEDIAYTDDAGVPVQILPLDDFRVCMESRGVGLRKRVVIYDNGNFLFATRLWWALRMAGHQAVAILDGGWNKWLAEDWPVTADAPCPLKINEAWESEFIATSVDGAMTPSFLSSSVDARQVLQFCQEDSESENMQIIDARSWEQYMGRVSRSSRAGHIPCALSLPYKDLLTPPIVHPLSRLPYRRMKSKGALELTLREASVSIDGQATPLTCVYCNGGVASTVVIFVLNQLYGMRTSNFDGSWNEWGKRDDFPVSSEMDK